MIYVLVVLLALSASCTRLAPLPVDQAGEAQGATAPRSAAVWPGPPAEAKIRFLYTFRDTRDLRFPISVFTRLRRLVLGEREQGMIKPYSVAVEGELIAVADPGARALHLFDLKKRSYTMITQAGDEPLLSPVGVVIGGGRIHISDSATGKVHALDSQGRRLFTIDAAERPTGLAFDVGTSRLFVADTIGSRIDAYDAHGKKLFSFGKRGTGDGEFNYPTHLSIEGDTLLVNDTMNFRVQAFDLTGAHRYSFGRHGDGSGEFAQAKGVGMDSEGHVYISDAASDRVQVFDTRGRFLLSFGGPGSAIGEFWLPAGLFVADDRIYVADSYNRRIQVFEFLGSGLL